MQIDFPATHSMDTDWFVVDRQGRIALFDSDREGVVPMKVYPALQLSTWYDSIGGILNPNALEIPFVNLPGEVIQYILSLISPWDPEWSKNEDDYLTFTGFIKFAPGTDVYKILGRPEESDNLGFRVSEEYNVFFVEIIEGENLKQADLSSKIEGYWVPTEFFYTGPETEKIIFEDLFGFYIYRPDDNWEHVEPYKRIRVPKFNVAASDLNLREEMLVYLPVDFQVDKAIQPMAFVPCKQWSHRSNYLDSDGSVHPVEPG